MHTWSGRSLWARTARAPHVAVVALLLSLLSGARAEATQSGDSGSPPPGEVPILFNDHIVHVKYDVLKRGRVLAALVSGHQIYVPLRTMFEQMGATVSVSADGKTVDAIKGGDRVSVTLGRNVVIINDEARPLDVPPMLYKGVILVPVRVLSEALGAYVQWEASRRVVVVRYLSLAPSPPPDLPPSPSPVSAPSAGSRAPAVLETPSPRVDRGFVQGAFAAPRNYNEFSAGKFCPESYFLSAGYMFKNSPLAVKADFREDAYVTNDSLTDVYANHYTRFATIDGGVAYTPVFLARQSSLDVRLEYKIAAPQIYVGVGYLHATTNYGYPNLNAAGIGLEKLPSLKPGLNYFGSAFYYPNARGRYTVNDPSSPNAGNSYDQAYDILKYDVGLSLSAPHVPVYVFGGFNGDRYSARLNAPIGQTHDGPYVGLGAKF